ncbi:Hypothetical protein, putative, partial [Bodo saltans]
MPSAWRQLMCTGTLPCGRIGHSLTTNTEEDTVYLYGGSLNRDNSDGCQYLQDFFAFDFPTKEWRQVPVSGGSLTTNTEEDTVYLYGGSLNRDNSDGCQYLQDFFAFDFPTKEWRQVPVSGGDNLVPLALGFHTAVYYGERIHIFGGCNGRDRFNTLFSISPQGVCSLYTSPSATSKIPPTRYLHSATLFEGCMYIFAGKCGGRSSNKRLKDMFAFNFGKKRWKEIEQFGADVPARSSHTAVTCGRRMVMFGGRDTEGECCEDLFQFSYDTHYWTKVDPSHGPLLGRARHSFVVHHGKIVIFGGWNGRKKLDDLLLLDSETSEVVVDQGGMRPCRRE